MLRTVKYRDFSGRELGIHASDRDGFDDSAPREGISRKLVLISALGMVGGRMAKRTGPKLAAVKK